MQLAVEGKELQRTTVSGEIEDEMCSNRNTRHSVEECTDINGQKEEETDQKYGDGRANGERKQVWLQKTVYQLVNWILYTVNFSFIVRQKDTDTVGLHTVLIS